MANDLTLDKTALRTEPDHETTGWPPGVPYIVGNEACERFSYYGMQSILQVHFTALFVAQGMTSDAAGDEAKASIHLFKAGVYAFPMIGAIVADRLIGKYLTIFWVSLLYCAGHAVLAVGDGSLTGMFLGLGLIAVGSGGIKPCVSANVGDQFGRGNRSKIETVYQIFYFSINFGSFFATIMIPWLYSAYGAGVAFGLPGVLMGIATFIFWLGRRNFVHAPPKPGGRLGVLDVGVAVCLFTAFASYLFFEKFLPWWGHLAIFVGGLGSGLALFDLRQKTAADDGFLSVMIHTCRAWVSGKATRGAGFFGPARARFDEATIDGPRSVLRVVSVFALVSVFWALFDQHHTSWIQQAGQMDLWIGSDRGILLKSSQIASLNPMLIMLLLPFAKFLLYPGFEKLGLPLTPLRRMTVGMAFTSLSFVAIWFVQKAIDSGAPGSVHVAWQAIPYVLITLGEVMVSVTGLEFAYTQAPKRMKSTIMGFWLLTVTLGNKLVALITLANRGMSLADSFVLYAVLCAIAAALFGLRAYFYVGKDQTA